MFIGKDILTGGTGIIPLFIQAPFATGVIAASGGALGEEFLNLAVSGTSFFNQNVNADLYLEGPPVGSGIGLIPLTLVTDPAPTPNPDGTISASGVATLSIGGNNPSGIFTEVQGTTTLALNSHTQHNRGMDLYVDFPLGAIIPLTMISQAVTGVLTLATSGTSPTNALLDLTLVAPFTNTMNLVSIGVDASGEAPTLE